MAISDTQRQNILGKIKTCRGAEYRDVCMCVGFVCWVERRRDTYQGRA